MRTIWTMVVLAAVFATCTVRSKVTAAPVLAIDFGRNVGNNPGTPSPVQAGFSGMAGNFPLGPDSPPPSLSAGFGPFTVTVTGDPYHGSDYSRVGFEDTAAAAAGGACPADGTIVFSPVAVEKGLPRRPGTARFESDGAFTVTSFHEGDGLIPGRYRPIVNCWKGEPRNDDPSSFDRLNNVPRNYVPDEVVVAPSMPAVFVKLDVPKK